MVEQASNRARYYPDIFNVEDLQRAKEIILTNEGPGASTEARWAIETPYLMELLSQTLAPRSEMLVLDYGCGVGRMAKALIDASGCGVIGLDASPSMRRLSGDYVGSDRFLAVSPGQFDMMVQAGMRVHAAIAVWVLQHCFAPAADIARIRRSLVADGRLFVLNMPTRAVPAVAESTNQFAWAHDGVDVAALLRAEFLVKAEGAPDRSRTPNMADAGAFWMDLRKRGN
jgi:SAM-dependent methyltransferase